MLSLKRLTVCLMLLPSLMVAASCSATGSALQTYPPAALLTLDPEPQPTPDIVTSAQAATRYQIAKDTWGRLAAAKVRGVCTWAKERGMKDAPC